ncbi:MAG TPA: glycosyltransferase family 1 protein [Spirochaetes bacterium]|nr:glycosyltransferase family 1 protein [Spirochaetota bacterium]
MKTIVHVLPYMAQGGTEKLVLSLVKGFHRQYNTVVLSPDGELLPEFLKYDITHVNFPQIGFNFIKGVSTYMKQLEGIQKKQNIDLVHVHAGHEFLRFSRKVLPEIPLLFHLHAHQGSRISKVINYRLSAGFAKNNADLLIAISEEEKKIVVRNGFPAEKVRLVYNGYDNDEGDDTELIAKIKKKYNLEHSLVIGNVGRLNKTKRLDLLIDVFRILVQKDERDIRLLFIGDGPDRKRLERMVIKSGLGDKVYFAGFIPRGDRVLKIFDVFVLPTTYEGCSFVLIEALAKGLPIITTDIPSVRWMFEDGKSAVLFEQNSVKDLCEKLTMLINDKKLQKLLSASALNSFLSRFDADGMIQNIDKVYSELIK